MARLTARLMRYLDEHPASEERVQGDAARRLQEALEAFGYGGDMVRGEDD